MVIEILKALYKLSLPWIVIFCLDKIYRLWRKRHGKTLLLRPLYPLEKVFRCLFLSYLVLITVFQAILSHHGLSLRPWLSIYTDFLACLSGSLFLSLVLYRRSSSKWDNALLFSLILCITFPTIFVWSGTGYQGEHDLVTTNGTTYLYTTEAASWSDHYTHQFEVINDFLMKKEAVDYDINDLAPYIWGQTYEAKFLED